MVGLRGGAGRATFQRHPRLKLSIHSNSYTDEEWSALDHKVPDVLNKLQLLL